MLPSCWTKSEASFKERLSALAPSTMAVARGCSDFCSTEATSVRSSSGFTFPKAMTSVREGLPEVTVPVLSRTTASTFSKDSMASALLKRIPFRAPRPVPTIMAVGVAKPNAHGQEITSTETAISSANSQEYPHNIQTMAAMIAMLMTVGTKIPLTLSAKRATGALVEVASSTNLIIWAKAVSPPTFVARISI